MLYNEAWLYIFIVGTGAAAKAAIPRSFFLVNSTSARKVGDDVSAQYSRRARSANDTDAKALDNGNGSQHVALLRR
jgi:hypothetical protein